MTAVFQTGETQRVEAHRQRESLYETRECKQLFRETDTGYSQKAACGLSQQ